MDDKNWRETADILNYGLNSQRDIADLNSVASSVIRNRDYTQVLKCFDELLNVSAEAETGELAQKQQHIDRIKEEFTRSRIEILKEANLLKELRHTNEAYIEKIGVEIAEAQKYCDEHPYDPAKNADPKMELLKKGIKREIAEKILEESGRDEKDEILKIIAKKRAKYDDDKLIQYLGRQGFSYELARDLVLEHGKD